jgi:predicted PurR-regulated permease PerM
VTATPTDSDPRPELVLDIDWRTVAVGLGTVLALTGLVGIVRAAPRTMTWLVIGGLLALALDPLVNRVEQQLSSRRGPALLIVLAGFGTAVALLAIVLGPETVRQARTLSDDIPAVAADLADLPVIGPTLENQDIPNRVEGWLNDLPDNVAGETTSIESAARSAANGLIAAGATLLIAVTLLLDGERLIRALRRLVPPSRRRRADELGSLTYEIVGRYFAGSVFVATLHGVYVLIVGLALGVPLAPLLAVWAAVFNLVPQIGGAVGGIPFVLLAFTQGAGTGALAAVLFLVYMNFENHVLQPVIIGEAVDLSAPTTMVAAIVGVSVAGVPGALVAVPLVGVSKAFYLEARGIARQPASPPPDGLLSRLRRRGS